MASHTSRDRGRTPRVTISFTEDPDTGLHDPSNNRLQFIAGGNVVGETLPVGSVQSAIPMAVPIKAITGTSGSTGVFSSTANPFGYDVWIVGLLLNITTQSAGASTVDIGVAANATTSNDGLIDGLSGATAGRFSNTSSAGTNGRPFQVWGSSQFLNVAEASGDVNALVADMVALCVRVL